MAWIKIEDTLPGHRKVLRAAAQLKIKDPDLLVGKLIRLWLWTLSNRVDGVLDEVDVQMLKSELRLSCSSERFVEAMVDNRLMDRVDGGYLIHDWQEFFGEYVDRGERIRNANRERQRRYRENKAYVKSEENERDNSVTEALLMRDKERDRSVTDALCNAPKKKNKNNNKNNDRSPIVSENNIIYNTTPYQSPFGISSGKGCVCNSTNAPTHTPPDTASEEILDGYAAVKVRRSAYRDLLREFDHDLLYAKLAHLDDWMLRHPESASWTPLICETRLRAWLTVDSGEEDE